MPCGLATRLTYKQFIMSPQITPGLKTAPQIGLTLEQILAALLEAQAPFQENQIFVTQWNGGKNLSGRGQKPGPPSPPKSGLGGTTPPDILCVPLTGTVNQEGVGSIAPLLLSVEDERCLLLT